MVSLAQLTLFVTPQALTPFSNLLPLTPSPDHLLCQVLLRYEGFGQDGSRDFWMNLCSEKVTLRRPMLPEPPLTNWVT